MTRAKHALQLAYLGLIVMGSAWIGVAFWMQTGERQTARLRVKYIQSVLQQETTFFDTEARDEHILYRISSDAVLVQDAIGDKAGHCQMYLSQAFVGLAVGLSSVWRLTLLSLAVMPLLVISGGTYAIIMSSLSTKSEKAYAEAGKVAEEVISQVRTVYSYVAEGKAIEAYSRSIETAVRLGKKSGLAKGLGIGCTYGLLYWAWALLLWFSGVLVIHRVTTGAKAFTTVINVIYSGLALGQAAPSLSSFAKGQAAANNIINMIEKVKNPTERSDNGVVLPKIVGHVTFSNVSFSYPSRKNVIFEDLSFVISTGRTFALVGESGSGKSTIISMIERFYEPNSAILKKDIGWFDLDENSSGSLASGIAVDATLVRSTLADRTASIIENVSLTVTAFVIAFLLSWRMAAVVIATYPLLIASHIAEYLFLKGFGGNYTHAYAKASSMAREAITNIRTVAAFGLEDHIAMNFARELDKPNKQARIRGHISGIGYGLSQFFSYCSFALGLWYASQLIKNGASHFNNVMKAFMVLIITTYGIANALSQAPDMIKGSQALGSVFSILDRKTTVINQEETSSEAVKEIIKGDIEFKNVSFRYPTRPDVVILEDLNFHAAAGSSLALVGQSGSGKSSVLALLIRFYDPCSGVVLIDGRDVKSLNLRSLRCTIGLVQQEPALFSTTIYENIVFGKNDATEIEVVRAATAANAHGFISQMPEGYKTQVGERGAQLSGGQKQRVAIARAILKDPSILLLDEATSALDTSSEKLVQEALARLMEGKTTIIVAHRLSTIRDANMIVVLRDRKVQEMGKHADLISQHQSEYSQLVRLQQESS